MTAFRIVPVAALSALFLCASCTATGPARSTAQATMFEHVRSTEHRGSDDLLTAGLGLTACAR